MDNILLVAAISAVVGFVLGAVIFGYFRDPQGTLTELKHAAEMVVADIEQTMSSAEGQQKLDVAIERLSKLPGLSHLNKDVIRMAIEAAVKLVKHPTTSVLEALPLQEAPKYMTHEVVGVPDFRRPTGQ